MKSLKTLSKILKEKALNYLFKKLLSNKIKRRISNFSYIHDLLYNKVGLEVGGPSEIFGDEGFIPIYKTVKTLDGCNFSNSTVWEGSIVKGKTYNFYQNRTGIQYISEATELNLIPDSKYEFVISSNCLEHVANPLKALSEWIRVIKIDGLLLLVLPDKAFCFDHKRPNTKFSHLLEDFQNNVFENDLTHLNEILELHDLKMDQPAGNFKNFKQRSFKNFENRTLHHHVFDINALKEMFNYFNLDILYTYEGISNVIIGRKTLFQKDVH